MGSGEINPAPAQCSSVRPAACWARPRSAQGRTPTVSCWKYSKKAFRVHSKERKTKLVPVQGRSAEIQQLNPTFLQLRDSLMRD